MITKEEIRRIENKVQSIAVHTYELTACELLAFRPIQAKFSTGDISLDSLQIRAVNEIFSRLSRGTAA